MGINLSMAQSQKLEQRMQMTAQMIHGLDLLQMPILELKAQIDQELVENPTLEILEEVPDSDSDSSEPASSVDADSPAEDKTNPQDELADTWYDQYERPNLSYKNTGEKDPKREALESTPSPGTTLTDHLIFQLRLSNTDPHLVPLCEYIIFSLNKDGYLTVDLEDLRQNYDEERPMSEWEDALNIIQSSEPAGVGARNIEECLLNQLIITGQNSVLLEDLLLHHFDDLLRNRYPKVAKATGSSVADVKQAVNIISQLEPKPGRSFDTSPTHYITPDVHVEKQDGEYTVTIIDKLLPRLHVSSYYKNLLANKKETTETKKYIKNKISSASKIIDSIEQRKNTLLRISMKIVNKQKDFLEKGPKHLSPLMMQDLAEEIGVHVSTVSRTVSNKYMQTPRGVFPLKFFFTGGYATSDGSRESTNSVIERIKEIVEAEDKKHPLSDQKIIDSLKSEGLNLKRRTVTKYREQAGIPSSRERKEF